MYLVSHKNLETSMCYIIYTELRIIILLVTFLMCSVFNCLTFSSGNMIMSAMGLLKYSEDLLINLNYAKYTYLNSNRPTPTMSLP